MYHSLKRERSHWAGKYVSTLYAHTLKLGYGKNKKNHGMTGGYVSIDRL